jgi:hypothetical protein
MRASSGNIRPVEPLEDLEPGGNFNGPFGSPVFDRAWKTGLHLVVYLSQTSARKRSSAAILSLAPWSGDGSGMAEIAGSQSSVEPEHEAVNIVNGNS